jgi:hypothetical protein
MTMAMKRGCRCCNCAAAPAAAAAAAATAAAKCSSSAAVAACAVGWWMAQHQHRTCCHILFWLVIQNLPVTDFSVMVDKFSNFSLKIKSL